MPPSPKYILHCPLVESNRLEEFVESCLLENGSLIAVFGEGCAKIEDVIDDIIIKYGYNNQRFICTTSHPNEDFNDVLSFVTSWEADSLGTIKEVRL